MSTEAEAILQKALQLPLNDRHAIAEELLKDRDRKVKSIHELRTFKPLPDVPPMTDHNEGFVEAIMFFKGMKEPREQ